MTPMPLTSSPIVLVPRAGEPGDRLAEALRAQGFTPLIAPLISFIEPADPAPLVAELLALGEGSYDWLILTSERTVDALVRWAPSAVSEPATDPTQPTGSSSPDPLHLPGRGATLPDLCAGARIAAVGPSTARRAREAGLTVDMIPEWEKSARGLVTDLAALGPARALVPHSNIARPELAVGLRAAGWTVREVDAYRTLTASHLPDEAQHADVVLLTSSSTATTWARLRAPGHDPVLISIGPRTSETALDLGLTITATASEPTAHALSATLAGLVQAGVVRI